MLAEILNIMSLNFSFKIPNTKLAKSIAGNVQRPNTSNTKIIPFMAKFKKKRGEKLYRREFCGY